MSDDNVLFVRGNKSEDEDIWDDSALIKAYDKAVSLAKEQVAKRIAMDVQDQHTKQKSQSFKHSDQAKKSCKKWTVGAPCRAIYSVDGEIYEAIITKIYENSGMCMVKYVGYQNTEKVELNSLLESNGLESQIAQQKDALAERSNGGVADSDTSTYSSRRNSKQIKGERMDYDTEDPRLFKTNFMPGPSSNPTLCGMPPPPPLPPQLMARLPETDADALSSMLMSWYISGFHTGYYHGLKQAKINQQKRRNCQ